MSTLNVQLGSLAPINLTNIGDLGKMLSSNLDAVFHLAESLASTAEGPLSTAPSNVLNTTFNTDKEAKWTIDGVNLSLSFKPTATGSITITQSGELFHYNPGDDPTKTVSITVPPGQAYVSIAFKVGFSVAGGAAFSSGNFGVSGNISDSDEFDIVNHKCFPESTTVADAIAQGFRGFILPFKAAGIENLNDNDYVDYSFIGSLALGFGVSYGYSGLLLGGRSAGEIDASLSNKDLGKIVFQAKPTFKASVDFSVKYSHADAFRVIVGRQKNTGANTASLYLFRKDASNLTTVFNAGITLSAGATFNAASNIDTVLNNAAGALAAKLPPEIQGKVSTALASQLKTAEGKIDGFVKTINSKVNALLQKGNNQKLALQVMQERIDTNTALFNYEFDLGVDPAMAGLESAMHGDFATAITEPGVSLAPGSFVENEFIRRTSIGLQFFDLGTFTDVTTYFQNTSAVYAGNGVFQLQAKTGVTHESGKVGHTGQCQVYFTAQASETAKTESIADLDVQLTFALKDNNNQNSALQTITALELLGDPELTTHMEEIRKAGTADKTITVTCTFPKGAYEALTFDPYSASGKPGPLPHPNDERNYTRFAIAVSRLDSTAPDLFKSYDNWGIFNVVKNGGLQSTNPPDRRNSGNVSGSGWPESFPFMSSSDKLRVNCYFEAGRDFMNLCEDLKNLTAQVDGATTEKLYSELLATLNGIINQDVAVFFIKPTLIALLRATNTVPANIDCSGTDTTSVEITFDAAVQTAAGK